MLGDKEFRRYFYQKWGVDLLSDRAREKAQFGGLDDYYFWNSRTQRYSIGALKISISD